MTRKEKRRKKEKEERQEGEIRMQKEKMSVLEVLRLGVVGRGRVWVHLQGYLQKNSMIFIYRGNVLVENWKTNYTDLEEYLTRVTSVFGTEYKN